MLSRGNKRKLQVFAEFVVDKDLPKYIGIKNEEDESKTSFGFGMVSDLIPEHEDLLSERPIKDIGIIEFILAKIEKTFGVVILPVYGEERYFSKLISSHRKRKVEEAKDFEKKVEVFFSDVKGGVENIKIIKEVSEAYIKELNKAKQLGQKNLVERMVKKIDIVKFEAILASNGFDQFLAEEKIIDFYAKYKNPKAMKLTWIKNFGRVIPDEVFDRKKKADSLNIFDNYVILHYDILGNSEISSEKEEKAQAKDPILFGLIDGSTRLYYVGDWIDEYCNLTLQRIMDELALKNEETILSKENIV